MISIKKNLFHVCGLSLAAVYIPFHIHIVNRLETAVSPMAATYGVIDLKEVNLEDFQEKPISLKETLSRKKITLLQFWKAGHISSQHQVNYLAGLQKKLEKEDFQVVLINIDQEKIAPLDFLKKFPPEYSGLRDPNSELSKQIELTDVPVGMLVDRDFKVSSVVTGVSAGWIETIKKELSSTEETQDD